MNKVSRANNVPLPKRKELEEILKKEVYRPVPASKEKIHYPKFESIIDLLSHYRLPAEIFVNDSLDIFDVVSEGEILVNKLIAKILADEVNSELTKILNRIYDYLSEEDKPEEADILFVFGGKTILRAEKALELYKKGLVKKVVLSGGNPIYSNEKNRSEADIYKAYLLENGVPEEHSIVENKSITVPDNIRCSLNLFDEIGLEIGSLILVNSPYIQRRAWAIFKKHLPDSIKIFRVNSDTKPEYSKDNWYKQRETLKIILNEFVKMRASVVYNTA